MANTKSAKKAVRQIEKRTMVNKTRRTRMRSEIRKVEEALAAGDQTAAAEALKTAQPLIARSAQKGIIHANTAARKISRLTRRLKSLGEASA
jgi:small subunit ribosomal protein S20